MKLEEIKLLAQLYSLKVGKMRKPELVRAIQGAEGNYQCYKSGASESCGQNDCAWRADCT